MQEEANAKLKEVLIEHSLNVVAYNDWLILGDNFPSFRASVHNLRQQGETISLQLDIEVMVEPETIIIESFAGWGSSAEEGLNNAFVNFVLNSLHVFLNAFCGQSDEQVSVEEWQIDQQDWQVVAGNYGIRSFSGQSVYPPESLFPAIEHLLRNKELERRIHWFRLFYCNTGSGDVVCECLLDNQSWEYAEESLQKLDWVKEDFFYSVRNFLIMFPK